jgi:hypothetical protein
MKMVPITYTFVVDVPDHVSAARVCLDLGPTSRLRVVDRTTPGDDTLPGAEVVDYVEACGTQR